ncbi:MAG TPA: Ig-like domain-containing protein, partial [Chitinophagaceae bacterium]|nr:Ig-like domain-containing protein [Chitinophagaceae bacterium]
MKKSFLLLFPVLLLTVISIFSGTGCANIIPPSGGPRDSLPPQLVRADPPDSTVNFKGNSIRLYFDEFVDLQDVSRNLLFTPLFENVPVIEAKLRTLTLRIRDTLEPNTTYTFNFGNAIKDINEGNVLRNFTYTFSTGPSLDSLTLSGK